MEIGIEFAVEFESPDLKMGIILAVLKHSGKNTFRHLVIKEYETVGAVRGARILYINTGIFMMSVDLFFCL